MNTRLKLTSGQLLQIIRLAKDNDNLDIDLLTRAMGLVVKETTETPNAEQVEQAEPKTENLKEENTKLNKRWTGADDRKLIYLYKNTSLKIPQIGEQLGRNASSIHNRLNRLRDSKQIEAYRTSRNGVASKKWTEDEDFFLKEELNEHGEPKKVPKENIELLGNLFDRTGNAVVTRLHRLSKGEN